MSSSTMKPSLQLGTGLWYWFALLAAALCHAPIVAGQIPRGMNISSILDALLNGYDKRVRPNYGGPPVEVGITMYITDISSVSEVDMDFTMDFYFRQFWVDPRLSLRQQWWDKKFSLGEAFVEKIWIPDTFFVNEKRAYYHKATTSNSFLRLESNGSVFRSMRLTVTASCSMNLRYFPMDNQKCTLSIESFGYTAKDVVYAWKMEATSVEISPEVELPQFSIQGYRVLSNMISLSAGNYSRLMLEVQFVRDMGYYLIQLYIPSGLTVIISWVSFWLNRNASPARVSLGVTTVLTMTTLMTSTNAALPKVSYVKSIDIYLGTCFVLVFAALIEYAAVGYLAKHQEHKERYPEFLKDPEIYLRDFLISPSDIDKYSRVAFPVFFLCFNLLYWIIYLQLSDILDHNYISVQPEK